MPEPCHRSILTDREDGTLAASDDLARHMAVMAKPAAHCRALLRG
jgi:hypothetical protein